MSFNAGFQCTVADQGAEIQTWQILPFLVARQRGGILLEDVAQVLRASAITRLPSAPGVVAGIINVHGDIVPVVDLRARFGFPRKRPALTDRFVLVRSAGRTVALHVDEVDTPKTVSGQSVSEAEDAFSDAMAVAGVVKLKEDLILIHDARAFLSSTEQAALDQALAERDT